MKEFKKFLMYTSVGAVLGAAGAVGIVIIGGRQQSKVTDEWIARRSSNQPTL